MLLLALSLNVERLHHFLTYMENPDSAILMEISRDYPSLKGLMEYVRQRDFRDYDIERAISSGTPEPLIRRILAFYLKDLYGRGKYRDILRIYRKYSKYSSAESRYYYILSLAELGKPYRKIAYRFVKENFRSRLSYDLYRKFSLRMDSNTLIKLLYFNKKYREISRKFHADGENAFYVMSSYFKMRKYDKAHEICSKWKNPSIWRYYLRCAIASEKSGDTSLAVFYIKRLHRYKPEKSIRLLAWFAIQDSVYLSDLMNLPDTHDEVFFVKSMLSMRYGDTAIAIAYLRSILNRTRSPFEKSRAYFWLWKLGNKSVKDSISQVHPYGYYALRVGDYPEILDSSCINSSLLDSVVPAVILEAFGLRKYAIKTVKKNAYLEAAYLLNKSGFYPLSIYFASKNLKNSSCLKHATLAFPTPYKDYFQEAADSSSLPVSLLYALAREESRFDSSAVSIAGARGIIQMMPFQFSKQIKKLGLPDRPFHVRVNLLAGAHHFSGELKQLGGDYELTICAYNAGKNPVRVWMEKIGLEDRDFFFEMIPYRETRNYFRRVYRSWKIYDYLLNSRLVDK